MFESTPPKSLVVLVLVCGLGLCAGKLYEVNNYICA